MLKALADRLAEAFAEWLHRQRAHASCGATRRDEDARQRGADPRGVSRHPPGARLSGVSRPRGQGAAVRAARRATRLGMTVTESFAMWPAASVSGFYLAHPDARYFAVGRIGDDQLADFAARTGLSHGRRAPAARAESLAARVAGARRLRTRDNRTLRPRAPALRDLVDDALACDERAVDRRFGDIGAERHAFDVDRRARRRCRGNRARRAGTIPGTRGGASVPWCRRRRARARGSRACPSAVLRGRSPCSGTSGRRVRRGRSTPSAPTECRSCTSARRSPRRRPPRARRSARRSARAPRLARRSRSSAARPMPARNVVVEVRQRVANDVADHDTATRLTVDQRLHDAVAHLAGARLGACRTARHQQDLLHRSSFRIAGECRP